MTATVAIQSAPSRAIQSADSSAKAASTRNNNASSEVENERKNSFKDFYDDAKKVDNSAEAETKKHDVNDDAGKEGLAEDGKNLPPEGKLVAAENEKEASFSQHTNQLDEDSRQDPFITQQMPSLNPDEAALNGQSISAGIGESIKDKLMMSGVEKQSADTAGGNSLSVLTGLNSSGLSKLNVALDQQGVKLALNDKQLNEVPVIVPGATTRSLAQRLSLTKQGDGLAKHGGVNEALTLSPGQLTDELMMSDMDKAFSKVANTISGADKLSLDAMLGKLETLTNTATTGQKQNTEIPLSTALNYSPISLTQESSSVSQTTIMETLGKSEWNQSMSKQIAWMASQNIRSAEIKLTPTNLGAIEVRVEMNEDKLNIAFSSRDAGVRDSLEQAMPKLREMMEEQGLDLGNTDVSEQSFLEQQAESFSQQGNFAKAINDERGMADVDLASVEQRVVQTTSTSMSAVDYYI